LALGNLFFYIHQCFGPFANFGMDVYGLYCFSFCFVMLVFWQKKYIKKIFLRVAYGQYPNMFLTFFYIKKTNIWSFENVFSHGFLKHNKKIIFLHLGFYNVFVNSKGCWPIFQKYKNLIFGNSSLFTINVWIKKSQMG